MTINWLPTKSRSAETFSVIAAIVLAASSSMAVAADGPPEVDFNRDVRPIFNEHCVACHGGVKQAGDLSFVYEDSVSYVVEPGDAEASSLIERVLLPDDDESRMPPPEHGRSLNEEEIKILRAWIDSGVKWGKHWAFETLQSQSLPKLENDSFSRNRMDRFVLAKMQEAGLAPSPDADAIRWLRRVSLELTGLPPTPQEAEAFATRAKQMGDVAYREAVDRLFASPGFGQRWASVWLDIIRYADSRGLGLDSRRNIWQYRDWVVRAFNADLPYDQFTIQQIAGDLLDDPSLEELLATACHRTTQTNEEGGTDDETFRTEAVMDRVSTTWQTWMGLSFGCVQCHSHPYDPIEHDEYYRFLAFFNNTVDTDLGSDEPTYAFPINPDEFDDALNLDRQIEQLDQQRWDQTLEAIANADQWSPWPVSEASTTNSSSVEATDIQGQSGYATVGTVAKNTKVVLEGKPQGKQTITALKFVGLPKDSQRAIAYPEWGYLISFFETTVVDSEGKETPVKFSQVVSDEPNPILDPNLSLNAKSRSGAGPYSRIHYPRETVFVLQQPLELSEDDGLKVTITFNGVETGAFPLVAHRGYLEVSSDTAWASWLEATEQLNQQLSELRAQRRNIRSTNTPVMSERPQKFSRPSFVFDRGNQMTKTDEVTPSTPAFLPEMESATPSRLDLARWIVDQNNPLTARVAVNRLWSRLFGTGLVLTEEDFGVAGERPTHPQLLDDLAYRFQTDMNWSVKSLLREILTSSTYRQSSVVTDEKLKADPSNQFLSRGPRTRLPAETIRDQALAISGLLSEQMEGPPVHPPIPSGIWNPFNSGDKWRTPESSDPDRYRRTVYTYIKRTIPYPIMASFDAPSREFCSVRRLPSNTPTQALMTLNDSTFVESAAALAERMRQFDGTLQEQIQHGFRLATCRRPSTDELDALIGLSRENSTDSDPNAFRSIATVLLNLDEVLCK